MARPRRQDARRSEIITAATVAIAERGLIGLRLKDIAEAAAMSAGSVAYYYPELDDLLLAVHERAVERFHGGRRTAMTTQDNPVGRLRMLVDLGVCDPDDPMWPALYELHLHSAREPRHAELMSRLFELEVSLYRDVISAGVESGVFDLGDDAERIAATAVALEDGYGIHLVARNREVDADAARTALRGYLAAVLACADIIGGRARPRPPSVDATGVQD
ncbi:putative TetR family transcriptional regulator [Gordonia polyisoprenivorans NBRC 16320 = JCM 10675]|uniref:TetR family transcriptional regulator n=1 Tax=Gordonia polyisoprenivorans TaxID=84595 RepID=A0A846WIK8_9ACTN|nr:TetR/AcrR family transcriptional regulator [Gordonia polyisoprenivorans]MBE7194563.1 TetR family transcriptional regulator C-terminal domain-containing protein [Gordonia polyisoprenivorans]NKY01565.1 TetR family transcriptional regulator [Gordonia polyisoprenivorans]UZF55498.1 TetR/AcrR family transcriptional regulator [Gordonia polyisoprenivorans]GAB23120.1 putative TetR family transcriptional regulator [Gordonia polyisoprenivorans NBRC 16320 = JCM 10675]